MNDEDEVQSEMEVRSFDLDHHGQCTVTRHFPPMSSVDLEITSGNGMSLGVSLELGDARKIGIALVNLSRMKQGGQHE